MKRVLLGPNAVEEALCGDSKRVHVVYLQEGPARRAELEALAQRAGIRCERRSTAELDALGAGARHQGVIAITGEYPYAELEQLLVATESAPLLVALDQISDPHNFGAIVRSAVAFGAHGIITLRDRAAPVTPVVVRASAGATERAKIARVTNLARTLGQLRERGMQIVGLAGQGDSALDALPYEAVGRVIVIGSEGEGLRRLTRESCDVLARVDLAGAFESLNASVAAGIALYESARARSRIFTAEAVTAERAR
jgi:23S rRNA (guanosine2251-2'-O)-methyltransferase